MELGGLTMKTIFKSFACAAAAALALTSCAKEIVNPDGANSEDKKTVTVNFGAETTDPASSRATLTPNEGETAFAAAWGNDDQIAITYTYVDLGDSGTVPGTWKDSDFSADITDMTTRDELATMSYAASYPYSQNGEVDFGSERTQSGGGYSSKYDIMVSTKVEATAKPGLDENGNKIVFPMERQTAIAYFHFTSDNAEEDITKATLTVEGGSIATGCALLDPSGFMPDLDSSPLSEIVLNVTGQKADDFTLWFNVLPTSYTKMTLTVETATKTFTISKNSEGTYEAGKLYKVKKDGIAWTDKGGSVTPSEKVSVINVENVNAVKEMGTGAYGDYKDAVQTITVDGLEYSMTSICANSKNGSAGYMMGAMQFIQMKASTSYIMNKKSRVTSIKAWVLPKTTDAISVYQGIAVDDISDLLVKPTKTNETVNLVSNTGGSVDTQLDVYEYVITSGFFKLAPSATLWLYKLEVTYSDGGSSEPAPDTYSISFADVTGGTLSANPASAEAGTEVTLTATPDEGYEFKENSWKVVAADDSEITVTDGRFIMPASDVTVTASFDRESYLEASASKTTVSADGETVTVTVDTNVDGGWTAESSDETNFTIGNKTATTFDVTVSKNETETARTATITVTAGRQTKTITLKQNATGGVSETIVVWSDDFSQFTKSNTTSLSSLSGSIEGFTGKYTAVSYCYPEVASIKLSSSKYAGSITTPAFSALSTTTDVTVTIEYAGYGTDNGTLNLSVDNGGTLSVSSLSATNTATSGAAVSNWDSETITITGATPSTTLKITASAKKERFFINKIHIETAK